MKCVLTAMALSAWLLTPLPSTAQPRLPEGRWWVVVGASSAPDMVWRDFPEADRAAIAARRCGVATLGDFSGRFENFSPDLYVRVAGPHRTRAEAQATLDRVRPCVADADLREGARAGD